MVIEEKDLTEAALLSALAELQANREKYVQPWKNPAWETEPPNF